jgi:hypothetical protein
MFDNFNGFSFMPDDFDWHEPDFLLSYLVSSLVNVGGAPLGITLLVKGVVITGTLVSEKEYLDTLSSILQEQVREALGLLSDEEREMAEKAFDFRDLTEDSYPTGDDDDDDPEDDQPDALYFLHLRNPLVVSPQPAVGFSNGPFPVLRLRMTHIDGWMLGASVPEDLDDFIAPNGNSDIRH